MKTTSILILVLSVFYQIRPLHAQTPLTLPYYSGFDTPAEKAGWQEFRTGFLSSYHWSFGAGALSHDYNVGGGSTDTVIDWFVSPPMKFTGPGTFSFSIKIGGFSPPAPDNLELWVGTNNPNPSTGNFTMVANLSFMEPKNTWLDTSIQISTVDDTTYIAFRYKSIGAAWWTPLIDSVNVKLNAGTTTDEMAISNKHHVVVTPNPVVNMLSFDFKELFKDNKARLQIYSPLGLLVYESEIEERQKLSIGLSSGFYYYVLRGNLENNVQKGKILVSN